MNTALPSDADRRTRPVATGWNPRVSFAIALSLMIGIAYPFIQNGLPAAAAVVAKGAGVTLLAAAALLHGAPERGWLAAIMAAGAAGDMLLELPGMFFIGAGAFALGHVVAMTFYSRNRRRNSAGLARLAAIGLVGWGLAMPALVSPPGTPVGALMLYSVLLCGMAAALLLSRFSPLATIGALLFIVSDTLLIMRLGGSLIGDADTHGLLVWLTYYLGQAMICVGVLVTLTQQETA